ncbi:MAG: hypothetical protein BSOLF_1809 [Candidatus Carbobacillus altaicus]|uniref:Uncharacterized protein n=1 Tax=Candidatus Carbonibacillus altaicus TaxID=2163959 RepID=A0A2R6XYU2_9BACL|nr:MAG: hypothetical protein BSOLF_1809 [Candidatus Carbobacillus altaicus]
MHVAGNRVLNECPVDASFDDRVWWTCGLILSYILFSR